MAQQPLPLLSEQEDRLRYAAWTEEQGLGEFVRAFGSGFRLTGPLDPDALTTALTDVLARYDALRAVFPDGLYSEHQLVAPPRPFHLERIDLRDRPEEDRLDEAIRLVSERMSENLDLTGGAMLRAVLARLDDHDHVLGLTADHMVADGECMEVILDELWRRYAAATAGERLTLPDPDFDYRDYLRWERDWLRDDPTPRAAIAETAKLLEGMGLSPPVTVDGRLRETNDRYTAGGLSRTVPAETTERFTEQCRRMRTTPFNALLAAFACALRACGGPWDIGLMIPTSRRTEKHLLDGVCMLSTYTTVRVTADPAASFRDFTRRVRGAVMRAHQLGQVPAREMLKALGHESLNRLFARPSLWFDVAPSSGWGETARTVGELTIEPAPVSVTVRHVENLSMFASAGPEQVSFMMMYPSDVFDDDAMNRLADCYVDMIDRCVRDPDRPVDALVRDR